MSSSFFGTHHRLFHGSGRTSYRTIQRTHSSRDTFCVRNEYPSESEWVCGRLLIGPSCEDPVHEPEELCRRLKSSGLTGEVDSFHRKLFPSLELGRLDR